MLLPALDRPNGFNQLLSVTPSDGGVATTFAYGGNGNQTSRTDASGVTQFVYGADDRLVGVALPNGGGSAYEYDANGLRVKKADSSGTTRYLLDGLSVIGQYGADGGRQAFYVQSLARIDEVLSVVNGQGKHWYQADALGSVYTLTTAAGEVRARGGYDVFGAPVAESGAAVGQPFGFTGREHELDAGLLQYRPRNLASDTGRFLEPDPLGFAAGPNFYGYVKGNPTRLVDPMGLAARTTVDAYAMAWPEAFLALLADLGVITARTLLFVGSAGAVAIPIAQMISPNWDATRERERTDACQRNAPLPSEAQYYRGLSRQDVTEAWLFGVVLSKFVRNTGADFIAALEYFVTGARNHPWSSDDINGSGVPSPFVSTTTDLAVARQFAEEGPEPGHVVVRLITRRKGVPSNAPGFGEAEVLFFFMIGMPGERLELVP